MPWALVRSLRLFRYQVFFCGNLQPTQTTTSFLNLLSLSPSCFGLCANHVRVQPRSPQTVRVGGGSNCFPLVGTREIGISWMIKFWTLVFTFVLVETFSGLSFFDMSSLSTEFIDVCARQLERYSSKTNTLE